MMPVAFRITLALTGLVWTAWGASHPTYAIRADFPGGNVQVLVQDEHTFVLAPDLRDTLPGRWWFYWNFALSGPAGGVATVIFPGRDPIGVHGPAYSGDGGESWNWMGAQVVRQVMHDGAPARAFDVTLPAAAAGDAEIRLAFGMPYVGENLERFLAGHRHPDLLREEILTHSPRGRKVPLLRLGNLRQPERVVLVTARHHSCEAMASYVLEGFMAEVLRAATTETGGPWQRWQLIVLPFMDRDGVESGDQGKVRDPHDHYQDYSDTPRYREVAALMAAARDFPAPVFAALDLHCPWIRGSIHERIHLVGSPDPAMEEAQEVLLATLAAREGGLPVTPADIFRFGVGWNTSADSPAFDYWATRTFPAARLVSTLEFPYASLSGQVITTTAAREFGSDLAQAIGALAAQADTSPTVRR